MIRLFVAIAVPDDVAETLLMLEGGVPGARWQEREQLHLTLRFIGEVDGRDAQGIDDALSAIRAARFPLQLKGVGEFGGKQPRALWAGVAPNEALMHLNRKIETALQRLGLEAESRKFTPHVTLARLRAPPRDKVMEFLVHHALYQSAPFEASEFVLYSSHMTPHGSIYTPETTYPLR